MLKKAIESENYPELLVETIEVAGELAVDDAANAGWPAFTVPRRAGRYTVVEGRYDDDGEAR